MAEEEQTSSAFFRARSQFHLRKFAIRRSAGGNLEVLHHQSTLQKLFGNRFNLKLVALVVESDQPLNPRKSS
jgi:hypothetical protein